MLSVLQAQAPGLLAETVVGAAMIAVVVVLTRAHRTEMAESRQTFQDQIDRLATQTTAQMAEVSRSLADVAHELRELREEMRESPR